MIYPFRVVSSTGNMGKKAGKVDVPENFVFAGR